MPYNIRITFLKIRRFQLRVIGLNIIIGIQQSHYGLAKLPEFYPSSHYLKWDPVFPALPFPARYDTIKAYAYAAGRKRTGFHAGPRRFKSSFSVPFSYKKKEHKGGVP